MAYDWKLRIENISIDDGVLGLIPGPVKSDTVSPIRLATAATFLPRRYAAEMDPSNSDTHWCNTASIMEI